MSTLGRAIAIAAEAHQKQLDKAGVPYILHPIRVMLKQTGETDMMAAILHDVVEDTDWTLDQLRSEGFSEEIVEAVDCLSRREGETYEAFTERVKTSAIARRVKVADLEDNMDVKRLPDVTERSVERLRLYHRVWGELKGLV